jgi:hypothetical protein
MGEESGRDGRSRVSGARSLAVVASCTVVALALRIALAGRSGIWCDEAQFIAVVRLPSLRSIFDFLRYHESHPCMLLAIACAIASWSSLPRTVTLAVATIFLAFSVSLHGQTKSNARELAAAVAARSRPSDMIVISPVWFVTSFNYYYKLPNPQSNYPHEERRAAIDYADLRKRLLDPALIAKTRSRQVQARREGRRIWFITLPQILAASVPEGDTLLDSDIICTYSQLYNMRTNQSHHQNEILYGPPNCIVVSDEGRSAAESFHAELYELISSPAQ